MVASVNMSVPRNKKLGKLLKVLNNNTHHTGGAGVKFTPNNVSRTGVISWPIGVNPALIAASLSTSTWNRFNSSYNCAHTFAICTHQQITWPMNTEFLRSFTNWMLTVRKLRPQTATIYLSDLKLAHKLRNLNTTIFEDFFLKSMIKGASNLSLYSDITSKTKFVMTYPLLKIVGHEIATSNWSEDSKRVLWTACSLAFFGSFRLGEILSQKETEFNPETLTWNNVKIFKSHAIVHIRFSKNFRTRSGDFVDIFPFPGCCPLECLTHLKIHKGKEVNRNLPVFTFENGIFLSAEKLTTAAKSLLGSHIGHNTAHITGHSFRAGIPAALANHPNLATDDNIKRWGRWSSDSYQAYTRLKFKSRQAIFEKITSAFSP